MIGIAFLANLSKREEYQTKDEQQAGQFGFKCTESSPAGMSIKST